MLLIADVLILPRSSSAVFVRMNGFARRLSFSMYIVGVLGGRAIYARLREEPPLSYSEKYDFYLLNAVCRM
ncbi:MAG TPA: hypothetical protein VED43_12770 [Mycobacterium sp.]|nr:hypothetical protein [Mycobacterium sp.]